MSTFDARDRLLLLCAVQRVGSQNWVCCIPIGPCVYACGCGYVLLTSCPSQPAVSRILRANSHGTSDSTEEDYYSQKVFMSFLLLQ